MRARRRKTIVHPTFPATVIALEDDDVEGNHYPSFMPGTKPAEYSNGTTIAIYKLARVVRVVKKTTVKLEAVKS